MLKGRQRGSQRRVVRVPRRPTAVHRGLVQPLERAAAAQALGQVGHADESLAEGDYPDKARTGDGSGLVLCVPKQSPQNTVQL